MDLFSFSALPPNKEGLDECDTSLSDKGIRIR